MFNFLEILFEVYFCPQVSPTSFPHKFPPQVFPRHIIGIMDASKLSQMRANAANIYRSNWQPRDASEVTQIKAVQAAKSNTTTHIGPSQECCGIPALPGTESSKLPGGFSTSYSYDIIRERKVGGAYCEDPVYGTSGVRVIKTSDEICQILGRDASGNLLSSSKNPVKGHSLYCGKSTEVVQYGITGNCIVRNPIQALNHAPFKG